MQNIPESLKKLPQWVCWKAIQRPGKEKIDKIPINPKNGYNAKSNDPNTWTNFNTAAAAREKFNLAGIGFMFANGYFGVDIDHCIFDGGMDELARDVIETMDSYTEFSPSGTGIHIICKGTLPPGERRNGQLEVYENGRFFTMTGRILDDAHSTVEERTDEIAQIHARYMKKPDEKPALVRTQMSLPNISYMGIDELIRKACSSKNGYKFEQLYSGRWEGEYTSQSNADMAFCNMLAYWTAREPGMMDAIFRQSGLYRKKWDTRHGRDTYGNLTIEEAIKDCREVYQPKGEKAKNPPEEQDLGLDYFPVDDLPEASLPDPDELGGVTPPIQEEIKFSLDDIGNAERLIHHFGKDIRFCCTLGKWLIWNNSCWEPDDKGKIFEYARETARRIFLEAYKEKDPEKIKRISKHGSSSSNHTRLKNMIEQAKSMKGIPISQGELDANFWLLNVKNGTIDLKTGKLLPHNREHLITKIAPVEYKEDATAPMWEAFMLRIFEGNKEIINFLQRAVGYSLTGSTKEQCLFISHGSGANGKSTFLDCIQDMIGDYAKNTNMNTFLAKQNDTSTNDIARLVGSRFVGAMEADEGKKLSESLVKQLTGGDKISARFLHKEFFDYVPTFKIWMGTNHKPVIKGTDNGIWRRIMLIPFAVTIPPEERDKDLPKKLVTEISGILNWAIKGCLEWQRNGLRPPQEVRAATDDYRAEMDMIKSFLNECCKRSPNSTISSTTLYRVYQSWCENNGEYVASQRAFSLKLKEKGIQSQKSVGIMYWKDIVLSDSGNKVSFGVLPNNSYKQMGFNS